MERQNSNIGNFVLQHNDNERNHVDNGSDDVVEHVDNAANDTSVPRVTRTNLSKYMKQNSLNYSHEDIHALASKAEFLVLTGSNTDLRLDNGDDGDESLVRSGPYSLDLQSLDTRYEEPCLSGTWEHDIQEQYISEGSVLATWDNSMKSVLCFGEDYSNYLRRKSELPSLDIINNDIPGLQVSHTMRGENHSMIDMKCHK